MRAAIVDSFIDGNDLAKEFRFRGYETHHVWSSVETYEQCFNRIDHTAFDQSSIYRGQSISADVIVNGSDSGLPLADYLRNDIELRRTDRGELAAALGQDGFAKRFVIKPRQSDGGYDRVSIHEEPVAVPEGFFVQPYFEGTEYSIDIVSENGRRRALGCWKYSKHPGTIFRDTINLLRYEQNTELVDRLFEAAVQVLDTARYRTGAAHIELIDTADGIKLVEVNFRCHGHFEQAVAIKTFGTSQAKLTVDALQGIMTGEGPSYSTSRELRKLFITNDRDRHCSEVPYIEASKLPFVARLYQNYPSHQFIPAKKTALRSILAVVILAGPNKLALDVAEHQVRKLLK